jgi:hypothetical protein
MTTTNIDICAQALSLLRANVISSFDDGSNEADICETHYNDFAEDILTRYPWSFATKKAQLNRDATAPVNEYRYAYIIPGECLRLWAVFASDEVGAKPVRDFDIQTIDGGRRVLCDYEQLWADYTVYTDEANWPAYFKQFAVHAFAALIAMPVTDKPDLASYYKGEAWGNANENEQGGKYGVAKMIDAQQKPPEEIISSPLIEARFG